MPTTVPAPPILWRRRAPTAIATSATRQFVWRGGDNTIYGVYSNGNGGACTNFSDAVFYPNNPHSDVGSDPAQAYSSVPQNVIAYTTLYGNIEALIAHGTWAGFSPNTSPAAVGKPAVFASSTVDIIDYVNSNGHIGQYYSYTPTNNNTWQWADIFNSITPTPPPSSGSPAVMYTSLPENVVVYVDTQGHVHQLSAAGHGWTNTDLTTTIPCSQLAVVGTQPALYASTTLKLIAFHGQDNNVWQFRVSGGHWTCENVTGLSGRNITSPWSGPISMAYVNGVEAVTGDGMLFYTASSGWQPPRVFGTPLASVAIYNGNVLVAYTDANGGVWLEYTGPNPL